MMNEQSKRKTSSKDIIIIIFIVALTALIITFINKMFEESEVKTEQITEEIINVKNFVLHWYNSFDEDEIIAVGRNELSFNNGEYPLTFAVNRMRAVFPDGKAIYIVFDYVKYLEFYQDDGEVLCVISFIDNGRVTFNLK